ncbi:MAG: glycosyltransferase [Duncaniella sp.]|nr:glycosyltransferase [Duncaniella sp.]
MISVIVPAYNAEKYLAECLTSILGQSYRDIEVLLINDGSTDSTLAIATDFAGRDARLKIFTTENQGVSCARNYGISQACGDRITFVDSDDRLLPGALMSLAAIADETSADIVIGKHTDADKDSFNSSGRYKMFSPLEAIAQTLYQTGMIMPTACGILYDRFIFSEDTLFVPGTRYEDLDIFYRLFENAGKIAVIPDIVYFYRPNPESFINTFSPSRFDALAVTERIERYMESRHPELLPAARDRRLSANFNILALLEHHTDVGYEDIKTQCWDVICRYRLQSLFNPKVRFKNKLGILVSFFGRRTYRFMSQKTYQT